MNEVPLIFVFGCCFNVFHLRNKLNESKKKGFKHKLDP